MSLFSTYELGKKKSDKGSALINEGLALTSENAVRKIIREIQKDEK